MPSDPYPATPTPSSVFYSSTATESDTSKRVSYWKRKHRATRLVLGLMGGVAVVIALGTATLMHWLG